MNVVEAIYDITKQMVVILSEPMTSNNRSATIESIEELLETREGEITKITPPYTAEEKTIGKKILHLNKTIEEKMEELYTHVKQDIQQMNVQNKSTRSYINPYGNIQSTDGMFMDRKQ